MMYSKARIDALTGSVLDEMIKHISERWIEDIYNTYENACSSVLKRFDVKVTELNKDRYDRMFLELLSFGLFLSINIASGIFIIKKGFFKKEIDVESKQYFRETIATLTAEYINTHSLNNIPEFVIKEIDPQIVFGYGEDIYFWNRVNSYAKLYFSEDSEGKEIELFGKNIGKALDTVHYPILSVIGGQYCNSIVNDISKIFDKNKMSV
ncbi:MAG: hypothetical protein ACREV6_02065 [Clostridium sp.]|uniref:hypothetical protein n=1 Tax=Clostridium sp. TaxID=1506 RepID=UPI003D6CE566